MIGEQDAYLLQIAGDGRVLLSRGARHWWTKPPKDRALVYEAAIGQTYETKEQAESVADNLAGLDEQLTETKES